MKVKGISSAFRSRESGEGKTVCSIVLEWEQDSPPPQNQKNIPFAEILESLETKPGAKKIPVRQEYDMPKYKM